MAEAGGYGMRMTAGLRIWVVGALAVFAAVFGQAQDLKSLKGIYEQNEEEIRDVFEPKFGALQQQYQKSLEALKAGAVKQGDLVRAKAAMAEIDRFQKAKSLPALLDENEIPDIKAFQSAYVTQYSKLEIDMTAQLGMLTSKFEQALERLEKELTKAEKFDAATEVHGEREKVSVAIKGYADQLAALKGPVAASSTTVAVLKPAIAAEKPGTKQDLYMVVDLSRGTKAAKGYPVSTLPDMPKGGWTDEYKTDKLVLRRIEPGTFMMGSPEDELGRGRDEVQHEVTLTKAYYIGVFEVTQKQWERVMGEWPSSFRNPKIRDQRPVETVSYNDIRGAVNGANWPATNSVDMASFMGRLRTRTGKLFDLPTEAQWEFACRAGTATALNSDKNLTDKRSCPNMADVGRHNVPEKEATIAVGSFQPNAWGLYDMHGNVWEWCLDWSGSYSGTETDPKGALSSKCRVFRSGSWYCGASRCRSAARDYIMLPDNRAYWNGLRVALTLP